MALPTQLTNSPILTRLNVIYRRAALTVTLVGLLALAGLAARDFLAATASYGIGVRTDSVAYLWGAENLAKGLGLGRLNGLGELKPMTHWPPFYPLVLTVFELAGMPALSGARYLGAALVAILLFLTGLTVWRVTRSLWFALGAAVLLALAPSLWITSLDAMTEPLYVGLGLAGALLLDQYLAGRRRWAFVLSALCMALAFLTRYAGISLIAAAGLVLLLDGKTRISWPPTFAAFAARLKQVGLFGALCAAPMLAWMLRNLLVTGSATNRYLDIFPIAASDWTLLWQTMGGWVFPLQAAFAIGAGKLALIGGAVVLFVVVRLVERAGHATPAGAPDPAGAQRGAGSRLPLFYAIYTLVYPLSVVLSRLAFDRLITIFEERIAFPLLLNVLLLLVFAAWAVLRRAARLPLVVGAALVSLYVLLAWSFGVQYRVEQQRVLNNTSNSGRSLNSPAVLEDGISQQARALNGEHVIYTDNIEVLYFVSGHHSFQINKVDEAELQKLRAMARDHRLTFIFFYDKASAQAIQRALPQLKLIYQDGSRAVLSMDE